MSKKPVKDTVTKTIEAPAPMESEGSDAVVKTKGKTADQAAAKVEEKPAAAKAGQGSALKTVSAWAGEKCLASWQMAALLRAMGWAGDKQVNEADFNKALGQAMNRRQGGLR